jgi:hypothetical protein
MLTMDTGKFVAEVEPDVLERFFDVNSIVKITEGRFCQFFANVLFWSAGEEDSKGSRVLTDSVSNQG